MGRGSGRARRLSLGAAVTFAVAAVAGVAGGKVTGHLTPALAVFAGLVVAGMLISYWVDRGARADSPADDESSRGAVGAFGPIDLRGAQGVQNIIASAPGAIAQGAMGGNVINHGDVRQPSVPTAPAPADAAEEEQEGEEEQER